MSLYSVVHPMQSVHEKCRMSAWMMTMMMDLQNASNTVIRCAIDQPKNNFNSGSVDASHATLSIVND